jgi:SAM-dependent methyltransferase
METKYNTIGANYNHSRKADLHLAERIFQNLRPNIKGLYLDIGCGTGNYTNELKKKGVDFIGIDPSFEMLNKAKARNQELDWRIGTAEKTGLERESIDGIIATLTIHHWPDLKPGFLEMSRVLKENGNIVVFTSTPGQMKGYWLNHYFPKMMESSMIQMPSLEMVTKVMEESGITIIRTEKYSVKPDLEDLFLYCGKHNPSLYFKPEVRNGISSFSSLSNALEVKDGLKKLEHDIAGGKIGEVIKTYENVSGDYLFIIGKKKVPVL